VELVFCSVWSPEAQAVELENAFKVGIQHLHLLSSSLRVDIGIGGCDLSCKIACFFVDMPGDLAGRLVGCASGLEGTG